MKRIIILIMMFFGINTAFADNFNYGSIGACIQAMDNYYKLSTDLAMQHDDNKTFYGFIALASFFYQFSMGNATHDTCNNGACTYTTNASCGFADNSNTAPWNTLIVPILSKEVNYLNNKQYDPNLTPNIRYYVHCNHQQGAPINWNNCTIDTNE